MELTAAGPVMLERSGAVLTASLGRPGQEPTITDRLVDGLHQVLDVAEAGPAYRLVVLRSAGSGFCVGLDLDEAASDGGEQAATERSARRFFQLMDRFTRTPCAVVSVVEGRAVGGGVGLAAASDLVIAAPAAQFSLPEALWGLLPCCVLPFLIRRTGYQHAASMTLTTQPVDADRAHQVGLVDQLAADPDRALHSVTQRLVRFPEPTVGDLKRFLSRLRPLFPGVEETATGELSRLMASAHVQDAIDRYTNGRQPPWRR